MTVFSASELGLDLVEIDRQMSAFRSLPIHTYYDPAIYEFEMEAIFHNTWQFFCPVVKLTDVGSVVVGQVGKIPVVVTRAEDGELHGFVNICRHRGYRVVQEDKQNCRRLVCSYHSWSYRLNGALSNAPHCENEPDFDTSCMGLVPVKVEAWCQGVFVNVDVNAPSLKEAHPNLERLADHRKMIRDPNHYRLVREIVTDQKANWKLWYDNGVECYHCPNIHGQSFAAAYRSDEGDHDYILEESLMCSAFKANKKPDDDKTLHSSYYGSFQIFPACQYIQQEDIAILARAVPTGPESVRFIAYYMAEPGADPNRVEGWIELWNRTYDEDAAAVELQQMNLRSGRAEPFRYVSGQEETAIFINSLIWKAYKAALQNEGGAPAQAAE